MSVLTSPTTLGDVFKYEFSPAYCRESGIFRNTSGAAIVVESSAGLPVKKVSGKWVPVLAADAANVKGLLFVQERIELANNTDYDKKVAVIVRGPVIINKNMLPAQDVAGDDYTLATLVTALAALNPPILSQVGPEETSIQTT